MCWQRTRFGTPTVYLFDRFALFPSQFTDLFGRQAGIGDDLGNRFACGFWRASPFGLLLRAFSVRSHSRTVMLSNCEMVRWNALGAVYRPLIEYTYDDRHD
jgi:hypothetical protein